MNRLLVTIAVIILVFIVVSFFWYRFHLTRNLTRQPAKQTPVELETAEGEIRNIDYGTGTLELFSGSESVIFIIDDHTELTQSGRNVIASDIAPGRRATVRYLRGRGRNLARLVLVAPSESMPQTQ